MAPSLQRAPPREVLPPWPEARAGAVPFPKWQVHPVHKAQSAATAPKCGRKSTQSLQPQPRRRRAKRLRRTDAAEGQLDCLDNATEGAERSDCAGQENPPCTHQGPSQQGAAKRHRREPHMQGSGPNRDAPGAAPRARNMERAGSRRTRARPTPTCPYDPKAARRSRRHAAGRAARIPENEFPHEPEAPVAPPRELRTV